MNETSEFVSPEPSHQPEYKEQRPGGVRPHVAIPGGEEIDLRALLLTLRRRKMVIVSTVVLAVVVAALTVLQLTPLYTASARIMLETRQSRVVDIESVISGISGDMAVVLSEVEVIRSSSLIGRVVEKLNLVQDPEFNGSLRKKPWYADYLSLATYVPEDTLISIGLQRPAAELTEEEARDQVKAKVVEAFIGKLSVSPIRRSLVISISFTSESPRKAALITNTLIDNYIVDQLEAKYDATKRATSWLNDRIGTLRDKVKKTEGAVQSYRSRMAGSIGRSSELTTKQIAELSTQLILARSARAEANARLDQVKRLLESEGNLSSAAEVLSSPLIQSLRTQEAEVLRKVSELDSRYGGRHPKMIKARAELQDLRRSIEREVKKIAQNLKNEVQVARVRENTLAKNLSQLEAQGGRHQKARIRLRELEREAQANRALFESFLSRFKETSEQESLQQQADTRLISKAEVPTKASFPKKTLTVILAAVGSLFLGVALVFVLERLDNSFRSSEQVEILTGQPVVGMVPLVTGIFGRQNVSRYVLEKPTSAVSESIRTLRTSLLLSDVDNPPKVVGITSSVPGEGKSTLIAWLAQVATTAQLRVIVVDCDLRRPALAKLLEVDCNLGLIEFLAGECSLSDAIRKDDKSGIHLLPAKSTQPNSLDLLSSKQMTECIRSLSQQFDLVLLDTPPVLAVSDAKIIGQLCDKMIYVVKWDSTPRGVVQTGIRAALEAKLDIAGITLTQVNVRKHAYYGYGDYGYYYGKYKDYYTS